MTECSQPNRPLGRRAGLAALALVALAACETSTGEPTAENAPAAQASPSTASSGAQAAGAAAEGAGVPEQRISMAECSTPSEGRVHFAIGDAVLAVPADALREVVPTGMQAPLNQDTVTAELRARAADGAGCPETPMEVVLLLVEEQSNDPLLDGTVGILRAPPGSISSQFARLTRDLQQNPTQNCRTLSGELLACVGTESIGERETPVMYVITTDRSRTLNTGGPLAARCVLQGEAIRGCSIVDEAPGSLTIDAALRAGTYTTEGLAQAHRAAMARVAELRREG